MKENRWMKAKSGLLVLLAAMLIAGCSGGGSPSEGANAGESGQDRTAQSEDGTKLRVYVPSNVEEFPAGTNLNHNEIAAYIAEQTGFDIEWELQPKENPDQKINIMMASGETPDLIITPSKDIYANLAQQGLLAPLGEALEQHGPRIMESVPEETWQAVTYDNQIYAIGVPQNQKSTFGMLVRTDILEELDIAIPKTLEEYDTAMRQIHDKKPDLIPYVGGAANNNGNAFGYIESFAGAFGLGAEYVVEDGEVVHTYTQPYAKDFLAYMRELYADGILGREYPVNKSANIQEKMISGQAVMTTAGWVDAKVITEALQEKQPDAKLELIHPPVGADGQFGYEQRTPVRVYMIVPRASAKVNEVVKFINAYMAEDVLKVVSYGWEGEHYTVKDGAIVAEPAAEDIRYRIYYQLWDSEENFVNRVTLKGFGPYYFPLTEFPTYTNIVQYAPPIATVEENAQTLTDLRNEYFIKIISGALPLEAFDEYVSKWESLGGKESLEEIRSWYATVQ
ncbi:extracellular solute-binding protein [Paenibacillus sp. IB182496]|uniref:Extracellular solute-binding protein n=1 Tax=Paenibacillus sabuli TaxID=2772509 RepID=A0A927BUI4_9BACL|nr:extracellular solute-binding protein [Paenibacillus sabuli]MBD2845633.1 extracellular solute-binding protein [Paenibacillus sabuli]